MSGIRKGEIRTVINLSIELSDLNYVTKRAQESMMSRSRYITELIKRDLLEYYKRK